jgi:hypothetical protein
MSSLDQVLLYGWIKLCGCLWHAVQVSANSVVLAAELRQLLQQRKGPVEFNKASSNSSS